MSSLLVMPGSILIGTGVGGFSILIFFGGGCTRSNGSSLIVIFGPEPFCSSVSSSGSVLIGFSLSNSNWMLLLVNLGCSLGVSASLHWVSWCCFHLMMVENDWVHSGHPYSFRMES